MFARKSRKKFKFKKWFSLRVRFIFLKKIILKKILITFHTKWRNFGYTQIHATMRASLINPPSPGKKAIKVGIRIRFPILTRPLSKWLPLGNDMHALFPKPVSLPAFLSLFFFELKERPLIIIDIKFNFSFRKN